MMHDTVDSERSLKNRRRTRVCIALVVNHDSCPTKAMSCIRHNSGGVESQSIRRKMGGNDIAVVDLYGLPKERLRVGKNCPTVGCGGKIVDARSRVDEVVVRS